MTKIRVPSMTAEIVLFVALSSIPLYFTSTYNYLLFHGIAEIFCLVIAFMIFITMNNSYQFYKNTFYTVIGTGYFFIAIIDLLHTFAFKGMNVFPDYDTNLATSLWIAGRYLESLMFLFAFIVIRRNIHRTVLFSGYLLISIAASVFIFGKIFPACYVEGKGLTDFKIVSEYVICIIMLANILLAISHRKKLKEKIPVFLIASFIAAIISELFFTLYTGPYDIQNLIGHLFEILSYYIIYRMIVVESVKRPYMQLNKVIEEKNILLKEVHHRVKNNLQNIMSIIHIQISSIQDPSAKDRLITIKDRIKSIGIVHELLYLSSNPAKIPISEYVIKILDNIKNSFPKGGSVKTSVHISDIFFNLNIAVPFGLILNEIITNSFKHAFPDTNTGEIDIDIQSVDNDKYSVLISDNGTGLPEDFDTNRTISLGFILIRSLVKQINGEISIESKPSKGTKYSILFKAHDK